MADLPLDIIGDILSRVGSYRDVMRASLTSRAWREAFRSRLRTLSFCTKDWFGYNRLPVASLEIIITDAILHTPVLERLLLLLEIHGCFSLPIVLFWIECTKEILRELRYGVYTTPDFNILRYIGRQKLEVLEVRDQMMTEIEDGLLVFPGLRCLILNNVIISKSNLCFMIKACPTLESLEFTAVSGESSQTSVKLIGPNLKRVSFESVHYEDILLKLDKIESLRFKRFCGFHCNATGTKTLKHLIIDGMSAQHFDIGDSFENLLTVEFNEVPISLSKLEEMISKSAPLEKLKLWKVTIANSPNYFDLEWVATSFPKLRDLSLCYYLTDVFCPYGRAGGILLPSVELLKVGWSALTQFPVVIREFAVWVRALMPLFPNLERLVITAPMVDFYGYQGYEALGIITTSIISLMQMYPDVEVEFEYQSW